jgi:tetratricopeptide (TPR) repeat protein
MSSKRQKTRKQKNRPRSAKGVKAYASFDVDRELDKALQYHQRGELKKAEKICKKILKIAPNDPRFLHLRGFVGYQLGKHDLAIEFITKATVIRPHDATYWYNLALPFIAEGRLSDALSCYQKALQLKPDLTPAIVNMGNVLQELGRADEAISCYQKALRLQPENASAYLNMGNAFQDKAKFQEALSCYEQALGLNPDFVEAYYNKGNAFKAEGRLHEAIACYEKAVKLRPDDFNALYNMGNAHQELNKLNKAISLYRKALEIRPDDPGPHNNMGNCFKSQGKFDEAVSCYKKALEMNPYCAEAFYHLANAKKTTPDDRKEILRLADQLNESELTEDGCIYKNFALGKIHDDLGQFEEAFEYYRLGNHQERLKHQFNPESHGEYIARIIDTFDADFFCNKDSWGNDSPMPIFIFGMPRSGTTVVEQIVSSHPKVLGAGELDYFFRLERQLATRRQPSSYPEFVQWMDQETARNISDGYLRLIGNLCQSSGNQARVTDKMPHHFLFLGLLFVLFPKARFIHCQRHPLDTCLSIYFQKFAREHHYAYDLIDIGHSYKGYRRLMTHWHEVLPTEIFEVRYEELVCRQEEVSRQLIAFCGLEWDSQCLYFFKSDHPIFTSSNWQVRQPMYQSSVERWKNYAQFLGPLRDLLEDLL